MIDPKNVRLLVEGGDDGHAVKHFLGKALGYEMEVAPKAIVACGDSGRLLDRIRTIQVESGFTTVGIIIDADTDPARRWGDVRSRAGNSFLPEQPDVEGTIATWIKGWRLGVWLMPKPHAAGDLEAFFKELRSQVDPQPALWEHAFRVVKELPEPRLFPAKDLGKAELRTWLAWQKEPGASIGLALSQGAFDLRHPLAVQFANWLARLLDIDPALRK